MDQKQITQHYEQRRGGPLLSHLYDPLLTLSATVRTPSTGRRRRGKLDHQF